MNIYAGTLWQASQLSLMLSLGPPTSTNKSSRLHHLFAISLFSMTICIILLTPAASIYVSFRTLHKANQQIVGSRNPTLCRFGWPVSRKGARRERGTWHVTVRCKPCESVRFSNNTFSYHQNRLLFHFAAPHWECFYLRHTLTDHTIQT